MAARFLHIDAASPQQAVRQLRYVSAFGLISVRFGQFGFLQYVHVCVSSDRRDWSVSCIAATLRQLQCLAEGLFGSDS